MATYKLIQDIEAEDHIVGPLSFRQFVFALIAVFFGYITFIVITKHVAVLALLFAPPALFFGFFALPFGRDQPTEIWALAVLRYWLKPRKRVWDQSGIKELVTINVPKKVEHIYTDGLSQIEVKSRLNALANTLDSRGWAVKNVNSAQPAIVTNSDRLVGLSVEAQEVPDVDIRASDDMLDNAANPLAQQFTDMIDASTQAHRQQLMDELNNIRAGQNNQAPSAQQPQQNWFMPVENTQSTINNNLQRDPSTSAGMTGGDIVETPEEQAIIAQVQAQTAAQQAAQTNMRTIPSDNSPMISPSVQQSMVANNPGVQKPLMPTQQTASAPTPDPAILSLAHNDDLNIATLARQADKAKGGNDSGEVVISLH